MDRVISDRRQLSLPSLLFAALSVAASGAVADPALPTKPVSGPPQVLEGDLLRVGTTLIRLDAIDAPEMKQTCEGKTRRYPCGEMAAAGLMDLTAGFKTVTCNPVGRTTDGTVIARCKDPQGFDLSRQMIYTGWAFALPDAEIAFHQLQQEAEKAIRGMWVGYVERPWRWRPEQEPAR